MADTIKGRMKPPTKPLWLIRWLKIVWWGKCSRLKLRNSFFILSFRHTEFFSIMAFLSYALLRGSMEAEYNQKEINPADKSGNNAYNRPD